MPRKTDGLIKTISTDPSKGYKQTSVTDGRVGIIVFKSDKTIVCAQINNSQRTATPSANTLEVVDPDKFPVYLQSMLDNGYTLGEGLDLESILGD